MQILEVKNLSFTYPGQKNPALKNVSFAIERGAYVAVSGVNGSGKSTLARILCGLLDVDKGSVKINNGAMISMVFQSPKDQIICGTVSRDTAFGPQNLNLDKSEIELRTIESLSVTDMLGFANHSTFALSLGQTQKVALSGIIALSPDVLVLDESVSMLDKNSRNDIFAFLDSWNARGHTIIHITHNIDAILKAKQVITLEEGCLVFSGTLNEFKENKIVSEKYMHSSLLANNRESRFSATVQNDVALSVQELCFSYGNESVLKNVSFKLRHGTLTALTGVSGSGKSTLFELCSGLLPPQSGKINALVRPALALQNSDAALFEQFAADDVAFGPRNNGLAGKKLRVRVEQAMADVALPFAKYADRDVMTLSGGEKKRLSIAGILSLGTQILFFDEPTAGLDNVARDEVMKMLRRLADNGNAVMFSTHQADETEFADREINIKDGVIARDTDTQFEQVKSEDLPELQMIPNATILKSLEKFSESASFGGNTNQKNSPINKMPALAKYLVFLAIFISSIAVRPLLLCGAMCVIAFIYAMLAKCKIKSLMKSVFGVIPFLLFFCIFQLVFFPPLADETLYVGYKFFSVSPSKIKLCAKTLLHTEAALMSIIPFVKTISEYELIDGLSYLLKPLSLVKIPIRYILIIVEMIFRFIPLLIDEAISIIKTQLVRGGLGKTKKGFARLRVMLPLFIPLIIRTIKRSEALADAITERCFK